MKGLRDPKPRKKKKKLTPAERVKLKQYIDRL